MYICKPKNGKWSDGRVARQRSAKPRTAVRIRFRPQNFAEQTTFISRLFCFLGVSVSTTHILHKNINSQMAVALHKRILRAIAHLAKGGCADIVFYCSGLRPALCRIRTSSGKALTSNPLQTSKKCLTDNCGAFFFLLANKLANRNASK